MKHEENKIEVLTIQARLDELSRCREFVEQKCRMCGLAEKELLGLVLACDEMCANIIEHGYRFDATKVIQVFVHCNAGNCIVEIRDSAEPFDPTGINLPPRPTISKRGHGIYLARRMAQITYEPKTGTIPYNITRIQLENACDR